MNNRIVYAELPAREVFNLCDPAYLPEVSREWQGNDPWHSTKYDALRGIMRRMYVDGFDAENGHYQNLRDSILSEGFRNPIICSAGWLQAREDWELPPHVSRDTPVCEYVGGSRLLVAQELDMIVPCIINDQTGQIDGYLCHGVGDVVRRFTDIPSTCMINDGKLYCNHLPYTHMHDGYTLPEQVQVRRRVYTKVKEAVATWLANHD